MILAFMVYSFALGVLAAATAWLSEKALAVLGRPRRVAWLAAIAMALFAPVLVVWFDTPEASAAPASPAITGFSNSAAVLAPTQFVMGMRTVALGGWSLDRLAAFAWALASAALIGVYLFSAWRLARRSRQWAATEVHGHAVEVAPDVGPAVFGWSRPRVIFPGWLTSAPRDVQHMALSHEREHLAARDPQLLCSVTLLGALFPWNIPLLWMTRRLRFAMEVDCDARVLSSGADANDYGLALLYVSERQARAPHTAIALIERTSQLERRIQIMFATPRKLPALVAGTCLALAGSCIFAAAQIEAPALPAAVLKPPPPQGLDSPGFRLGQRFELLLQEQYPELLRQEFRGTPVVVALVNDDWTIAGSAKTMSSEPIGSIEPKEQMFGILGVAREDVPYVGAMNMQLAKDSDKFVLMVYTEKKKPDTRFVSSLFPDTRAMDRALYQQAFAAAQPIPAGQSPWVLLDRSGKVLRSGIETVTPDNSWLGQLQQRYRVRTREVTVTPLTDEKDEPLYDDGGKELQLNTIWLAPDSPMPAG